MTETSERRRVLHVPGLKIELFETLALLGADSVIVSPGETGSDHWLVHTEAPDRDPLLTLRFEGADEQPDPRFVSQMIGAMVFAYHSGVEDGEKDIKTATSFALRTLLGQGDWFSLREAAADSAADAEREARSSGDRERN